MMLAALPWSVLLSHPETCVSPVGQAAEVRSTHTTRFVANRWDQSQPEHGAFPGFCFAFISAQPLQISWNALGGRGATLRDSEITAPPPFPNFLRSWTGDSCTGRNAELREP